MRSVNIFLSMFIFLLCFSVQGQGISGQDTADETLKTKVYYFHMTRRCNTCRTVEAESEKALTELYPEKMKEGLMAFQSVNIEDEKNDELREKLGVTGQTLLIVKGDKKKDITSMAFLYAKSSPDKLKKELKQAIQDL